MAHDLQQHHSRNHSARVLMKQDLGALVATDNVGFFSVFVWRVRANVCTPNICYECPTRTHLHDRNACPPLVSPSELLRGLQQATLRASLSGTSTSTSLVTKAVAGLQRCSLVATSRRASTADSRKAHVLASLSWTGLETAWDVSPCTGLSAWRLGGGAAERVSFAAQSHAASCSCPPIKSQA